MTDRPEKKRYRRRRKNKPEAEVVVVCNPRAGGRWKELAGILDADEARGARRIVTDSVEDIASAIGELGKHSKLLCVYGGDGTIQRVLDRLFAEGKQDIQMALLGGGTMNVTARWCGFSRSPAANFRYIMRAFNGGELLIREVPLLEVESGAQFHRGFTFGMGPVVRLVDHFEQGKKGRIRALGVAGMAAATAIFGPKTRYSKLLTPMPAQVFFDDEHVPYDDYTALFANVTGQINPGVKPFTDNRERDQFYCAAYSVSPREFSLAVPSLIRGWLPLDPAPLLKPISFIRGGMQRKADGESTRNAWIPTDKRYVNTVAKKLKVTTDEPIYTLDGEILPVQKSTVEVEIGPTLKLALGPGAMLGETLKMAKAVVKR